jgi:hypothetical protein
MLKTVSTPHLGNTFEETCIMWKIVLGFVVFAALSLFVIFKSCDSFKLCEIQKIALSVASHCARLIC